MRGVAGILFVFLGLVMGYMILSGKFPSTSPIASTASSSSIPLPSVSIATTNAAKGIGGGPMGLPTMAHLNDLVASQGGMQ